MASASIVTSLASGICTIDGPTLGQIITGSSTVSLSNKSSARNTDIVLSFCGHVGILVEGSSNVKLDNQQRTRIGSTFTGDFTGIIITGESSVNIGG